MNPRNIVGPFSSITEVDSNYTITAFDGVLKVTTGNTDVTIVLQYSEPTDVLYIKADATNNRATLHGDDNDSGNHEHFFNFTYKIS